jgi:hypothetical protein
MCVYWEKGKLFDWGKNVDKKILCHCPFLRDRLTRLCSGKGYYSGKTLSVPIMILLRVMNISLIGNNPLATVIHYADTQMKLFLWSPQGFLNCQDHWECLPWSLDLSLRFSAHNSRQQLASQWKIQICSVFNFILKKYLFHRNRCKNHLTNLYLWIQI